jgi:hypothetical protein
MTGLDGWGWHALWVFGCVAGIAVVVLAVAGFVQCVRERRK